MQECLKERKEKMKGSRSRKQEERRTSAEENIRGTKR